MTPKIIFFYSIIVIVAGIMLLFFFRLLIRFPRAKKNHEEKDSSEVGFVVDTFHELVSQLKEKEKELKVLRKQAEDRATAIEGYNEKILQSVQSGVVSLDEGMRITKINLAAAKVLEIKGESVIGQYHDEVLNKPITDFLRDKKVIERGEISYVTPSGKRIWLGLTLSPLKDSEGATIGQILIFTDLTHLKAIECQLAQAAQGAQVDDRQVRRIEGIINSMTAKERAHPELIKASRKRRIAAGAGVTVQEVNRLLNQFEQTQKVMKMMAKGGLSKMMRGMKGMFPGR